MFEKGKWYYNKTYKYKIKYLKESDTKAIVYTDIVSEKGEYKHYPFGITGVGHTDNKNWVLIEDLSEIQQYLSDNHPDKIKNNAPFKIGDSVYLEKHYKHDTEYTDYSKDIPLNKELKVEKIIFTKYVYGNTEEEWIVFLKGYTYGHPACKFKLYNKSETKVTQDKFKVGDFFYYIEPSDLYQVTKINSKTIHIKGFGKKVRHIIDNYYNKDIFYGGYNASIYWKKAKLEEIPVKDLSTKEILEIAKQYYPIGTKFKVVHIPERESYVKHSNYFWGNSNNVYCASEEHIDDYTKHKYNGCLYYNGKWAEIISTSQEVKDDFVLPEKWYVVPKTKDNLKIIQEYEPQYKSFVISNECNAYTNEYRNVNGNFYKLTYYTHKNSISPEFIEITTEQFKKYVLGEKSDTQYLENYQNKINNLIGDVEYEEDTNEIYIPTITKQKKKIDYTINSVFADIKVNLPEKPKKIVKPIVLEKFNLII